MTAAVVPKPQVLFLAPCLRKSAEYCQDYEKLMRCFEMVGADVVDIQNSLVLRAYIRHKPLARAVILLDDKSPEQEAESPIWEELAQYMRAGGTVVCAGQFLLRRPGRNGIASLFRTAKVPWSPARYLSSTTLGLHRKNICITPRLWNKLPLVVRQRALIIGDVPSEQAVCTLASDMIDKYQATPWLDHTDDTLETSAALAMVGVGKLGYLGVMDIQYDTLRILQSMIGLNTPGKQEFEDLLGTEVPPGTGSILLGNFKRLEEISSPPPGVSRWARVPAYLQDSRCLAFRNTFLKTSQSDDDAIMADRSP